MRKADPVARRQFVLVLIAGICIGALFIDAFERYRVPLSNWLLADADPASPRAQIAIAAISVLLLAPLFAFALYLWSLGDRVIRAREFPPPGLRVVRDTAIIVGDRAETRGRLLKALAIGCAVVAAIFGYLLWRFVSLLSGLAM